MVRGTPWVVGVLLTLGASLAQPAVLESDALLQRRITVWFKLEPMPRRPAPDWQTNRRHAALYRPHRRREGRDFRREPPCARDSEPVGETVPLRVAQA
ncbi:MAG: hypothetical protein NZ874_02110 [Fimbriimonadales bacterium]|nr:hypothetical protein [Fimbriimonadales bacterium]